MVEFSPNIDAAPATLEINKSNIVDVVRFSADGTGLHPEVPEILIVKADINPNDIVSAVFSCVEQSVSINAAVVRELLKRVQPSSQHFAAILTACIDGIMNVRNKEASVYRTKHPELGEWRWLRKWVIPMLDTAVNKELDPY